MFTHRHKPVITHQGAVSVLCVTTFLTVDFGDGSLSVHKDDNEHCLYSLSTYYAPDTGLRICINPFYF